MSRGSTSDINNDSPDEKMNGGAKSPTRNGAVTRPTVERQDTEAWATENENEGDEKVCARCPTLSTEHETIWREHIEISTRTDALQST